VFRFNTKENGFERLFFLPATATHTSGLAFHPQHPDLLFAVDYDSKKVYVVDFPLACQQKEGAVLAGKDAVIAQFDTGLRGPSACCFVKLPEQHGGGLRLIVTDFRNSNTNYFYKYNAAGKTLRCDRRWSFRNEGFSQGIVAANGQMYESGNTLLLGSYLVMYDLGRAIDQERITAIKRWTGPSRFPEDVAVLDNTIYITDEGTMGFYRAALPGKQD
jgi:hypothetical protein